MDDLESGLRLFWRLFSYFIFIREDRVNTGTQQHRGDKSLHVSIAPLSTQEGVVQLQRLAKNLVFCGHSCEWQASQPISMEPACGCHIGIKGCQICTEMDTTEEPVCVCP